MPIGFAIFITALLVSVIVLLIYHYVILGTSGGNNGGSVTGGYNYDENIAYLNTLANALASYSGSALNTQLGYASGNNYPDLPSGADKFTNDLS